MDNSTTKAVKRGRLSFRYSPHRIEYSGWITDPSPVEVVSPEIVSGQIMTQIERVEAEQDQEQLAAAG